jgi:hypothetical protein
MAFLSVMATPCTSTGDAARRLAKPDAATDLARLALDSMGQERR